MCCPDGSLNKLTVKMQMQLRAGYQHITALKVQARWPVELLEVRQ